MTDPVESPTNVIPFVDYLVLEPEPHLLAHECSSCQARYFDHRVACASCFGRSFVDVALPRDGTLISFSIITFAAPGVDVPFVAALVDLGGTTAKANLVGVPADPDLIWLGMPVRLTTTSLGTDAAGVEAVNYAFAPIAGGDSQHGTR